MWTAHIAEKQNLYSKQIIGVDGFVGLPYADGCFLVGGFKTTRDQCLSNIYSNREYYKNNYKNIKIAEFLFSQKNSVINFLNQINVKKLCFIHIDCDVSASAFEVFDILLDGNLIADNAFIVFDDYHCDSNLRNNMELLFSELSEQWDIQDYSRTDLTHTFRFIRKAS